MGRAIDRAGFERRLPALAAGTLVVVGVGLAVVSLLIWASQGFPRLPQSFSRTPAAIIPSQVLAVSCMTVGALLGHRAPRNPVGWLFLASGYAMVLVLPVALVVAEAHQSFRLASDVVRQAAWLVSSLSTPIVLACLTLVGLYFPDGRLPSRWQRAGMVVIIAGAVTFGAATAFDPSGLVWYPTIANPFAAPPVLQPALGSMRSISAVLILAAVVFLVTSIAMRYRWGDPVTRAQLRWIVFAALVFGLSVVPFILARYVVTTSDVAGEVIAATANLGAATLPVAAAFAITRYRLFGIDRLINRALVYVPLMGVLGGLYALAVAVFQRLFVALTGGTSDAALLIAVFLIAAVFTPLRKALEGAVDGWVRSGQALGVDAVGVASVVGATGPSVASERGSTPADVADSETLRAAATLAAVRRLEARLANRSASVDEAEIGDAGSTRSTQALPIDGDGRVACPAGSAVPFSFCLGCPYLSSVSLSPPEVRCWRQQSAQVHGLATSVDPTVSAHGPTSP